MPSSKATRLHHILLLILAGQLYTASGQIAVLENGKPPKSPPAAGLYPSTPTRTAIDLSGTWSLSADGDEWQDVQVPSSVDEVGRFMFRRTVAVPPQLLEGHAFKFVALGMNHDAEVYVNDIYIGRHIGGYTSFSFDIPEGVLQQGSENAIQVVVHNELSAKSTIPLRQQSWGWRTYGGMLRDVQIIALPQLWIEDIRPEGTINAETRTGTLTVQTVLSGVRAPGNGQDTSVVVNASESYLYTVTLTDLQADAVVAQSAPQVFVPEPNKSVELSTTLILQNARVWRPERPDLYRLDATVFTQEGRGRKVIDNLMRTVGFPDVRVRQGQLFEQGVPLHLRGVVWHEESSVTGASLTYEQMERDMAMIKSIGANAVRFAFHPPHPYLLDLCSRYGLYAFVEIPVWNAPAAVLDQETIRGLAQQAARETVEELRHHPSVLAWGVAGNVDASDERTAAFVASVASVVRSLDRRPVYAGVNPGGSDRTANALDMAAVFMRSNDVKEFRATLGSLRKMYSDRPSVVLSYGPQVEEENRNGYRDPWSQEAQARFFLQHIAAVKESGFSGGFVDAFSDWMGDRPVLTIRHQDRTLYPLGLVSLSREKRLAYDVVRSQYQEEKFAAIPAGSYRAKFPASQVIAGLLLIIMFGYQYSYNRRFGESVKRAMLRSYNFFADLRDRGDVPVLATFILSVCIAVTLGVVWASLLHHYRTDAVVDALMSLVLHSDMLKNEVILASWDTLRGIAVFSAASYLALVLLAVLIKTVSLIVRVRLPIGRAWNITVWGALPLMVLSPVGMSLFKVMETPAFVLPVIILIGIVTLWSLMRIVKGTSVVLDISAVKTYTVTLLVCAVVGAALFLFAENQWALTAYLEHLDTMAGINP